jgi:hypothetical protein
METFDPNMADPLRFAAVLKSAVETKRQVSFKYGGFSRRVCPHMLAKTTDGRILLHGFQFAGQGSKGPIESPELGSWRYFYLDQFDAGQELEVSRGNWYPPQLAKSEDIVQTYKPPKNAAEIIALTPRS